MLKLDLKDKKVLFELDLNSKQSISLIAKKVGLSKEIVSYRLNKLIEGNIISGFYAVIDNSKLGLFGFRVYLKLIDANKLVCGNMLSFLTKNPKITVVSINEGAYDLGFMVYVASIYKFEKIFNEFKLFFNQFILTEKVSVFSRVYNFKRVFLLEEKQDLFKPEIVGGNEKEKFDFLDVVILKELSLNARTSIAELSAKLKKPPRTIAFRIKQLEKKKIIQGYRILLNLELLGLEYYKVDVKLKDFSRMNELLAFCHTHPNILYVDQTIGGSDFEFDLEVNNKQQFFEIINLMKKSFPEIRYYDYFTINKYVKLQYIPDEF